MRTRTTLAVMAVAALVALAGMSCKKKGKDAKKDTASDMSADMKAGMDTDAMKAPMGGMDAARPRPRTRPAAKASLFDPGVFKMALMLPAKKDPVFAKIAGEISTVAAACQKKKKYLSSFTWCTEWKALAAEIKKILTAIDKKKPATVRAGMAVALAGVSKLRDKDIFVRFAGLVVMEHIFYNFSYKGLKKPRALLARVVALSVKNGTKYDERKQAIRVLGCDGGLSHFNGGVYDGKVLAWAAHKDKSHWVRQAALGHLSSCMDRLKDNCPVKPSQLKAWAATEKDKTSREAIAKLAGKLKMTDEVFTWCTPILMESQMHWGCDAAFKSVLDKSQFDKFHALAKKYRDSDGSKTANNFRMIYPVNLMIHGLKKGFPKEKVVAYVDSVMAQEETATKRAQSVIQACINGLVKIAGTKAEVKMLRKLLKKRGRKFAKAVKKDKNRKKWSKLFKDADKTLAARAKVLKATKAK